MNFAFANLHWAVSRKCGRAYVLGREEEIAVSRTAGLATALFLLKILLCDDSLNYRDEHAVLGRDEVAERSSKKRSSFLLPVFSFETKDYRTAPTHIFIG
jgi:hypothetical protein